GRSPDLASLTRWSWRRGVMAASLPPSLPAAGSLRRRSPRETSMQQRISRRAFTGEAVASVTSPGILRHARGDAPIEIRCPLDTAPSHPRNIEIGWERARFVTIAGTFDLYD